MYSRKFNQSSLPPDYSGVSFRRQQESAPAREEARDITPHYAAEEADCTPRYPLEDRKKAPSPRRFTVKRPPRTSDEKKEAQPAHPLHPPARSGSGSGLGALASHSFTMEDIVLAGLILLLLNSDCDSELLLVLGFLLLVGLQ